MSVEHSDFTLRDVEVYAQAMWDILLTLGIQDGHCKRYDPMTIEQITTANGTRYKAHSYVFDLWDGGRHHTADSLEQIREALLKETTSQLMEKPDAE